MQTRWLSAGDVTCWVAEPVDTRAAVIVLPELFGISEHVMEVGRRLASHGYRAVVPDLFHRVPDATALPETDEGRTRGFEILADLSIRDVLGDVEAAIDIATDDATELAGLVGLSVGGYLGFRIVTEVAAPRAVLVYPGWLDTEANPLGDGVRALDRLPDVDGDLLVLVGDADRLVTESARNHVRAAFRGERHRLCVYRSVGHGYLAPHRTAYDPSAAETTWHELLAHLGGTRRRRDRGDSRP